MVVEKKASTLWAIRLETRRNTMQKELKKLAVSIAKNVSKMGFRNVDGHAMTFRQGLDVVAKLGGMKAWQAVAAMKPQKGTLKPDGNSEYHHDYVQDDKESVWITVKGHSIYINPTDEGVVVDVYAKGAENNGTIATTYAFDTEAEASYCEANGIDRDDVAEWVGLHYKVNFDAESAVKRMEWLHRYVESHSGDNDEELKEPVLDDITRSILDSLPAAKHVDEWCLRADDDVEDIMRLEVVIDGVCHLTAIGFNSEAEYVRMEGLMQQYYRAKSRKTVYVDELLGIMDIEVREDPDQPGLYMWHGIDSSLHSKEEAVSSAVFEAHSRIAGYYNLSTEQWNELSQLQILHLARDMSEHN